MKTVLGLDRIGEYGEWFEGRKIGLITNYSGINSAWENNIDLFEKAGYDLAKLYTPEHGLYGAADGAAIENGVYPGYNIPVNCSATWKLWLRKRCTLRARLKQVLDTTISKALLTYSSAI